MSRLGRYTLLERIGAGGQGEVWRAVLEGEAGFRKPVAVKRLRGDGVSFSDSLVNEALICVRLDHPNLVTVYELFRHDDEWVLAMELLDGEPLDRVLARGPLSPELAVDVMGQVAAGVAAAHGARDESGRPAPVVHRDLKPGNVFLTRAGVAKVLDFGIAVAWSTRRDTMPGSTKGTVAFLAPEQLDGAEATPASDVWAVGALAYEVATGEPLVPDMPVLAALHRIQTLDADALGVAVAARVPALGDVVRAALQHDPTRRPAAADVADRLRRPTADPLRLPPPPAPTWTPVPSVGAPPPRATRPMVRSLRVAALLAATAVAGLAWAVWPTDAPLEPVRVAWPRARGTLAYYTGADSLSSAVVQLVVEPLVRVGASGEVEPVVLGSVSHDGAMLALALAPDVAFPDHPCTPGGRAATAEDLLASLELGRARGALGLQWSSASVSGDTVTLALPAPVPVAMPLLHATRLVPASVAEGRCDGVEAPNHPVGTGPWTFAEPPGERPYGLTPRARGVPPLAFSTARDLVEASTLVASGAVHLAMLPSAEWLVSAAPVTLAEGVVLPEGARVVVRPGARRDCVRGMLLLRDAPEPLDQASDRRSLAMALDRDALDDIAVGSPFRGGRRLLDGGHLGYDPGFVPFSEDVAAAAAAWSGRATPVRIGAYPRDVPLAQAIAAQAARAAIAVEVVDLGAPSLQSTLDTPRIAGFVGQLCLPLWRDESLLLLTGLAEEMARLSFAPPDAVARIASVLEAPDRVSRGQAMASLEAGLLDAMGFIPLGRMYPPHVDDVWLVGPSVASFDGNLETIRLR